MRRVGYLGLGSNIGDRRAQALERLIGPLLGHQVGRLAHLAVVDRVLDPVGDGGVAIADIEPDVDEQALADLSLGRRHPHVGEQRQPADLDRDFGLRALLAVFAYALVEVVVLVGIVVLGHRDLTVAAVTVRASWTGRTSWTRNTRAPRS